ncbi:MAG TPA: GNAT family N-acetyltransferase [Candidatus Binataceae bacterium]|nr:GNAT family N-acetyltransferase [Candidatus Binataceae bacterium]
MEFRAARHSERGEVLDLLALWYNDRAFFARYNENDPTFRDELCLVALDDGRIVATVQVFDRAINFAGLRVPMGGIGSVFTLDDYRHKGVASGLMRLAIETMTRAGFEVSLLFAERLTFYNQFEWREVSRKFSVIPMPSVLRVPTNLEIETFDQTRDLAAVAQLHREYTGRFNVTAVRDDNAWRGNLTFAGNQPQHPGGGSDEYFVLCRRGGDVAAYARVAQFHGVAMVMEYAYQPGGEENVLALFRHLGEVASGKPSSFALEGNHDRSNLLRPSRPDAAPGLLISHTAHDRSLEAKFAAAGCPVMHHPDNFYMWRILNGDALAKRMNWPASEATARAFRIFESDESLFWTSDRF